VQHNHHKSADTSHRRPERGQALVEFALVLPVMLLLLLLAVDFGRLFFTHIAVTNAAREGAFYAAEHASDQPFDKDDYEAAAIVAAERETNVQAQGGAGVIDVDAPRCYDPGTDTTIDCAAASNFAGGVGNYVEVTARQDFTFLTPIIGDILGGTITLDASATGPVLNPLDVTILPGPSTSPSASPSPAPTLAPTPSPTAPPTLPPGETPTPSPEPTPTPSPTPPPTCVVPDFYHTYFNDIGALTIWTDLGFTGTLTDNSGGKKIQRQTLTASSTVLCSSNMTVSNN
jgi:Flp pilus assembly protein TadG